MLIRTYELVKKYPFFLLGVATFGLFLAAGSISDAAKTSELGRVVIGVLRVLIIPLWLMRDVEMLMGMGRWPGAIELVVGFPFLFAPYILADYVLSRARTGLLSSLRSHSHRFP
jgi:hypothetical protein